MEENLHQDKHLGSLDVDLEMILSLSLFWQIFYTPSGKCGKRQSVDFQV
jgi:hypothetical protein